MHLAQTAQYLRSVSEAAIWAVSCFRFQIPFQSLQLSLDYATYKPSKFSPACQPFEAALVSGYNFSPI